MLRLSLALLLWSWALGCKPAPLPQLGVVPQFSLRDQRGEAVTPASLRGQPFIANFVFTRCPDVCPLLTSKLAGVRSRLVGDRVRVRYVSFSVDPAYDSPEVLARYAQEHHVAFDDWRFVTGDAAAVQAVIVKGFKQSLTEQPGKPGKPANILHGTHFVLADAALRIRGYYRSDEEGMLMLARDARRLVLGAERGQDP